MSSPAEKGSDYAKLIDKRCMTFTIIVTIGLHSSKVISYWYIIAGYNNGAGI